MNDAMWMRVAIEKTREGIATEPTNAPRACGESVMIGEAVQQPEIRVLVSEQQLRERVAELAEQISRDYAGKQPLIVGVLKGAWVFLADLVRRLTVPTRCDFIKLSSYGEETVTTGRVQLHLDLHTPVEGQDILIVEDIVDTGTSVLWLLDHLRRKNPASIRLCALLDNPARRIAPITLDYVGFAIPNCFVVGYGIDWKERFRELPYIGRLS